MSDTMIDMEPDFLLVDVLNADQLEVGDLIGIDDEIVKVIAIAPLHYGFNLAIENNFGEQDFVDISEDDTFDLYVENFN
jgi:hypothetical protein